MDMETITVIYDDTCNLCKYLIAQLRGLSCESPAKFIFVGSSQREVSYLGVSERVYSKEICVLSNGRFYTGHYAIGFILSKLPQTRYKLLGYAIKAASVAIMAGYIYKTISRYRYWIGKFIGKK
jgi:predicted DCC family thiol-disulfide oxidoreductase YuxK